jgi:muramoyltetrapeptide carboxypeptidase
MMPTSMVRPKTLRTGSRVALVSPAGPIDDVRLQNALDACARFGLDPVIGEHARARNGYLAGTDEQRASDLNVAIADADIDAIWALRGGYGTARLLHRIDLNGIRDARKAYIGFSDNTTMHLALARAGIISFHAPHAGGEFPELAQASFRSMLFGEASATNAANDVRAVSAAAFATPAGSPLCAWEKGSAEGQLIGGNLAVIAAAEGTSYAIPSDGAILFLEEIGEPPYRVDRLVTQLLHSGVFARVAGVIIGQFTDCENGDQSGLDVVRRELSSLGVPILANAPIGHVAVNWTLPIGARVRIDADTLTISLLEPVTGE